MRLDPAFAYAEPPSSWPLPREEFLTLAPGSDRLPVELFQILKNDAVESAALNMQYALSMQYAGSRQSPWRDPGQPSRRLNNIPSFIRQNINMKPELLQFTHRLMMIPVCILGLWSRADVLLRLFPNWDFRCAVSWVFQCCLSLDVGQNLIWWYCLYCFYFSFPLMLVYWK